MLHDTESRTRYDSIGSDLTLRVSHARTDSNVSSISMGSSTGYHDRDSSFDNSMELEESWDSKLSPNSVNPPPKRLLARIQQQQQRSTDEEDKNGLQVETAETHPILMRQRSISLTEKKRSKSPSIALIAENRSSSFHGSTEFSKITSSKRSTSDAPVSTRSSNTDDDSLNRYTSATSLTEVKILSDKTIVFRSGVDKDRSLSFDSSQVSDLRRDRLLVSGSQLSEPEVDTFKPRSRTSSYEKAELAKRLGLKSGDISQRGYNRTRSTSSGYGSDATLRKKVVNSNSLLGNTDYVTISGDSNKHARSSSDSGRYTTMRDASGYVALSTLRRQNSLSREALVSMNSYSRPLFTPG